MTCLRKIAFVDSEQGVPPFQIMLHKRNLQTITAALYLGMYVFLWLTFKVLRTERFLFLSFTLGLLTWAPGQGLQGRREGRREEGGRMTGKEPGSELVKGGWVGWGQGGE